MRTLAFALAALLAAGCAAFTPAPPTPAPPADPPPALWRAALDVAVVDDDVLVAAGPHLVVAGRALGAVAVAGLDASSGAKQWRAGPEGPEQTLGERVAGAAFTPDAARVVVAMRLRMPPSWDPVGVRAYDAASGALAWATAWSARGSYTFPTSVVIGPAGRVAFVAVTQEDLSGVRGGVLALDTADGRVLWNASFAPRDITVRGGRVVVSADGSTLVLSIRDDAGPALFALRAADGAVLWRRLDAGGGDVHVAADTVFAASLDPTPHVEAISLADGSTRWKHQVAAAAREPFASALGEAGVVLLFRSDAATNGTLRVFDRATGASRDIALPHLAAPARMVVGGGSVFLASAGVDDPASERDEAELRILRVDVARGVESVHWLEAGARGGAFTVGGGRLYVALPGGRVLALDAT